MNLLKKTALTLLLAGAAYPAGAFTYADGDLLLVFRKDGFSDVEYNLGPVANFLGKPDGTAVPVPGWDLSLVEANFNNNLANVNFLLVAATAVDDPQPRIWASSAQLTASPTDLSRSRWGAWRSEITSVGTEGAALTATNASPAYVVPGSEPSSFTFIASGGGQLDAGSMSGLAPFGVEKENPTTLAFYQVKISNSAVKPPAALVGVFRINGRGTLQFRAGPVPSLPQASIANIARSDGVSRVNFATVDYVNYRLWAAPDLSSAFVPLATMLPGDDTENALTETANAATRYYRVESLW
jgi:hypothetical protein